jgi:hypothetical protein
MQVESSNSELWIIWYGILKLDMSYELALNERIDQLWGWAVQFIK